MIKIMTVAPGVVQMRMSPEMAGLLGFLAEEREGDPLAIEFTEAYEAWKHGQESASPRSRPLLGIS